MRRFCKALYVQREVDKRRRPQQSTRHAAVSAQRSQDAYAHGFGFEPVGSRVLRKHGHTIDMCPVTHPQVSRPLWILPSPFKLQIELNSGQTHLQGSKLAWEASCQIFANDSPTRTRSSALPAIRRLDDRELTHGLNRDVFQAPCVSSPLCCLIRRRGLGVEPI